MAFRTHWGGGQPPSPLPWLARTPMLLSSRECCILAVVGITACTHLLPKTAIKLPFRQQICLFQDTNSPFLTTKSPETTTKSPFLATKSPVSGYKVAVFGNKCGPAITAQKTRLLAMHNLCRSVPVSRFDSVSGVLPVVDSWEKLLPLVPLPGYACAPLLVHRLGSFIRSFIHIDVITMPSIHAYRPH